MGYSKWSIELLGLDRLRAECSGFLFVCFLHWGKRHLRVFPCWESWKTAPCPVVTFLFLLGFGEYVYLRNQLSLPTPWIYSFKIQEKEIYGPCINTMEHMFEFLWVNYEIWQGIVVFTLTYREIASGLSHFGLEIKDSETTMLETPIL